MSAHPHMLTHSQGGKEPPGFEPHQLDDVGNTEPVGWLDVLASFHKALVALQAKGDIWESSPTVARSTVLTSSEQVQGA